MGIRALLAASTLLVFIETVHGQELTRDETTILLLNAFGIIGPFLVPIIVGLGEVVRSFIKGPRPTSMTRGKALAHQYDRLVPANEVPIIAKLLCLVHLRWPAFTIELPEGPKRYFYGYCWGGHGWYASHPKGHHKRIDCPVC